MLHAIALWTTVGFGAQLLFAFVYYGLVCGSNLWPFGAVLPFPWGVVAGLVVGFAVAAEKSRRRADKS